MKSFLILLALVAVPALAADPPKPPLKTDVADPAKATPDETAMFSPDDFQRLSFDAKQAQERVIAGPPEPETKPVPVASDTVRK